MQPGLYLVPTPIGNLGDMTQRGIDVLAAAGLIACEDTRTTKKLLQLLGIQTNAHFVAYHEHNADQMRPVLLDWLDKDTVVALVSDAGTPLISDPGYRLVRDCLANDIAVIPLPGANAVLPALQLSGLPSDRFLFGGFLASKKSARQAELRELATVPATLMFYESPHRMQETLADMLAVLGDRAAAVVREISKKFEESRRGLLSELIDHYKKSGDPKGEIVIVVDRASKEAFDETNLDTLIRDALKKSSVKEASEYLAAQTGLPKKKIYTRALEIKNG